MDQLTGRARRPGARTHAQESARAMRAGGGGLTLPKYRSSTSTYRCMTSSVTSSLSPEPTPHTKKSDAYRRYTTFVSARPGHAPPHAHCAMLHTFVFQDVAHAGPSRQDELCDVLDDLGFGLWGHGREPFCQAYFP